MKSKDPEAALLSLQVADVACGSGHILLAAARRIGQELAVVRTGEDQPSPLAITDKASGAPLTVALVTPDGLAINAEAVQIAVV